MDEFVCKPISQHILGAFNEVLSKSVDASHCLKTAKYSSIKHREKKYQHFPSCKLKKCHHACPETRKNSSHASSVQEPTLLRSKK